MFMMNCLSFVFCIKRFTYFKVYIPAYPRGIPRLSFRTTPPLANRYFPRLRFKLLFWHGVADCLLTYLPTCSLWRVMIVLWRIQDRCSCLQISHAGGHWFARPEIDRSHARCINIMMISPVQCCLNLLLLISGLSTDRHLFAPSFRHVIEYYWILLLSISVFFLLTLFLPLLAKVDIGFVSRRALLIEWA